MIIEKVTRLLLPHLEEGDILFRYPLQGDPVESFDGTDGSNLAVFTLDRIDPDAAELCFEPLRKGYEVFVLNTVQKAAEAIGKGRVVEERKWWRFRPCMPL